MLNLPNLARMLASPMRVVILADPLDNQHAGIHYYTWNLVSQLGKVNSDIDYYILRRKKDELFPEDKQIVVKNYRFPGYAALRMFWIIPRKLRKLKVDVVVEPAHFGPFNLPKRMKRVTVIHDLTPILFPHLHRFHSQLLQRIFLKGILRRAKLIISNSKNTAKDIESYDPVLKNRIISIYLGRDEHITYCEQDDYLKRMFKEKPYFLFAGTIEPRKNLTALLKAYELYRDQSNDAPLLVIAGRQGWKNRVFFEALRKHPFRQDIILTGYLPRHLMAALYSQAIALLLPSLYEGFGLPVVEAMSCGTPCLLSETSSLPEVGGEAALYFNPEDPASIAKSMIKISTDESLRRALSKLALQQAAKFSWKEYALIFDQEIKKLINE